jgi:hypothetical protein
MNDKAGEILAWGIFFTAIGCMAMFFLAIHLVEGV